MFNPPSVTLTAIANTLQQIGINTLPAYMNGLNASSQVWAYNVIVSILSGRGYLLSQILAWDLGVIAEQDMTVYRSLMRAAALLGISSEFIKTFDWRQDLATLEFTIAGVWTAPAGAVGQVVFGVQTQPSIYLCPEPWGPGANGSLENGSGSCCGGDG